MRVAVTRHVALGGAGAQELAQAVLDGCAQPGELRFAYPLERPLVGKIEAVAKKVYRAKRVDVAPAAARALARFEQLGFGSLPVLIAKTHLSVTADPKDGALSHPEGWTLPIREVRLAAGAGYVYALTGEIQTMPGLGSRPAALGMDLTASGEIVGLS